MSQKKLRKITEIWAWICTEDDGGEGIPAMKAGNTLYPLIGADAERMQQLEDYAQSVAAEGKPIAWSSSPAWRWCAN